MINKRGYRGKPSKNKPSSSSPKFGAVGKADMRTEEQGRRRRSSSVRKRSSVTSRPTTRSVNPSSPEYKRSKRKTSNKFLEDSRPEKKENKLVRLNKHIANSGVGSRRHADELIRRGLISVNKKVITEMGHKVSSGDIVRYEDRVLKVEKLIYVLLNKPKGFITTTSDSLDRKTVMDLIGYTDKERLYPVGRLDRNTTGLLLLTNDGDLANRLMHPAYQARKIYKVELDRPLTKRDFQKILSGVWLEEGKAMADELAVISTDKKTIGIELHIGWNQVVHRIFGALGYKVLKLDRTIYAGLDKKDLPRGKWRFLTSKEIVSLKHFKKMARTAKKALPHRPAHT